MHVEREGRGYRSVKEVFDHPAFLAAVGTVFAPESLNPEAGDFEVTLGQLAMCSFKVM